MAFTLAADARADDGVMLEHEDDAGIIEAEIPGGLYRSVALREGGAPLVRPRETKVFLNAA
jgi:hypothetical protein